MANHHTMYLDVRTATFKGDAVRILAKFDLRNSRIQVSKLMPFMPSNDESELTPEKIEKKRAIQSQALIITDSPDSFDNYDIAFKANEHLEVAANAYITYQKQGVLILPVEIQGRANVSSVLDAKKLELTHGMVWALDPQRTNNLHIAILAMCYGAKRANAGSAVLNIISGNSESTEHDESLMPFTL